MSFKGREDQRDTPPQGDRAGNWPIRAADLLSPRNRNNCRRAKQCIEICCWHACFVMPGACQASVICLSQPFPAPKPLIVPSERSLPRDQIEPSPGLTQAV